MSLDELRAELARRGLRLLISDAGKLQVDGPRRALDDHLRQALTEHRGALRAFAVRGTGGPADAHVAHVAHGPPLPASLGPTSDAREPPSSVGVSPPGSEAPARATCSSCATGGLVFVDFETRSPLDIGRLGGRTYAASKRTEFVCAVAALPDGTWVEWTAGEGPPVELRRAVEGGAPVVAHNGLQFDRFVWEREGLPRPTRWIDTLQLARLGGLPRALGALGPAVLGTTKDQGGQVAMRQLSKPDIHGLLPPLTPTAVAPVLRYCRRDVELLRDLWDRRLHGLDQYEQDVRKLDTVINDRGFLFDEQLAHALIACETEWATALRRDAQVPDAVLRSTKRLRALLRAKGLDLPDVRRPTVRHALGAPTLDAKARTILEARLAISGIARHKLEAALKCLPPDARIRDALVYAQAHTGRWSGRRFQPHNLPRTGSVNVDAAIDALQRGDNAGLGQVAAEQGMSKGDLLSSLVRACIIAPPGEVLGVVDYSAIEARALAWVAGEQKLLERFRNGEDVYKAMASTIFGRPAESISKSERLLGKVAVLGCGYGMGADRLREYAETFGVRWDAVRVTPKRVTEAWRMAHPAIAGARDGGGRRGGLWHKLEEAAVAAARGYTTRVGPTRWEPRGNDVVCVLPSGRPMTYRKARVELVRTTWGAIMPGLVYERPGSREETYGAKLTENVVQAICRDLLADAMLRLDAAGFTIVLHVHDEVVTELPNEAALEEQKRIMCTPPEWAKDLPLAVEGYADRRYRK